jgi:hypothetical protein
MPFKPPLAEYIKYIENPISIKPKMCYNIGKLVNSI